MIEYLSSSMSWTSAVLIADWIVRLGLSVRLIMRGRPVGYTLAWLAVVLAFPLVGAAAYLMFGELRLGRRRGIWAERIHGPYHEWLTELVDRDDIDWTRHSDECRSLARLCQAAVGIPALGGNALEILVDAAATFRALVADIDAAKRTCHLEFYIWQPGGTADDVAAALIRAAARGVRCRILVDDVGSREFLEGELPEKLRAAGIQVQSALPVGLLRMLFYRLDLRMHRKIAIIDGEIAYTGSMNLVDPRFFKRDAGVGEWIDAMARLRGPAVEALGVTFLEDWELETGEGIDKLQATGDVHPVDRCGQSVVQVLPSGPIVPVQTISAILLSAIYSAHDELILTSPYFVPDELMLTALLSAAGRGVQVTLVLPARVDSHLVRLASQAHKGQLLEAGVRVVLFEGGLLHTKSVTVDGRMSLFGSLNLDPRSLQLNFEITLAVYDEDFTRRLRELQQAYIAASRPMELAQWQQRSALARFVDNAVRLVSPLL